MKDKYCKCGKEISKKAKMCVKCNNTRERDYSIVVKKRKETMMKKYNVENAMFSYEFKEKLKETNIKIYGCENVFQNESIKEKLKQNNIEKHGVEYPSQSELIREKMKNSWLEHYGVEHPSQSDEIKEKKIITCLKNWNVKSPGQSIEIMDKIIKSRNQNRRYNLSDYEKYRVKVDNLTRQKRKKLFEDWNGFDYYDNEYIKDNFKLNPKHKNYPSVDHKQSVFYSFTNGIDVKIVADIHNLCITKRTNNSRKNRKNEEEFINSFLL